MWFVSPAHAEPAERVRAELASFLPPDEIDPILVHLDEAADRMAERLSAVGPAPAPALARVLSDRIATNLAGKHPPAEVPGYALTDVRVARTVVDYEIFRLERYVTAGVAPKRWFGWFDLLYDTADQERDVRSGIACATRTINDHLARTGDPLRISEADVAVTFIAEGGALLVRPGRTGGILPVAGIGLDHIGYGVQSYDEVARDLDLTCGTDILGTLIWTPTGTRPEVPIVKRIARSSDTVETTWLTRTWTLREAAVGTALMWLWEQQLTAILLEEQGRTPLHARAPDARFVLTSLVYNSGDLHSESTLRAMLAFDTGAMVSAKAPKGPASGRLSIDAAPPATLLAEIVAGQPERPQPTGWLSVYNVMQRYGAWVALHELTDTFDAEGRWQDTMFSTTCPPK